MRITIRNIGTSKGIIIPSSLLKSYQFEEEAELQQTEKGILLSPTEHKRIGWEEAAKQIASSTEEPIFPDTFDEEHSQYDDWEWEKNK